MGVRDAIGGDVFWGSCMLGEEFWMSEVKDEIFE